MEKKAFTNKTKITMFSDWIIFFPINKVEKRRSPFPLPQAIM